MTLNKTADEKRGEVVRLIERRDAMQTELDALAGVLESHGVTMDTALVTEDGFPRADIDVAQIRMVRTQIIRLKNDYRALMGQIEQGLGAYFQSANGEAVNGGSTADKTSTSTNPTDKPTTNESTNESTFESTNELPPFARIQSVEDNSPAAQAGLLAEDRVCRFGLVDATNHRNLTRLATVVATHAEIPITVVRGSDRMDLMLIPDANWGGRGSIGCHLVPL